MGIWGFGFFEGQGRYVGFVSLLLLLLLQEGIVGVIYICMF